MKAKATAISAETMNADRIIDSIMEAETLLRDARITDIPRLEAEILLAGTLGIGRSRLIASYFDDLGGPERNEYLSLVMRRTRGEPIAYITGEKEFMGFAFHVDPRALIPRPETETLVEQVLATVRADKCGNARILDIGTGCGCIAVSLALLIPAASIHATDVSAGAIELARRNAGRHRVGARISFHVGDLYSALPESLKNSFDLIVSNPPYVSDTEYQSLDKTVREFEPSIALRGGNDGLDVFRALVARASDYLDHHGWLAIEIGEHQSDNAAEILERTDSFSATRLVRDLTGRQRVIMGMKTE